ncbi:MAG TPA: hypothetical protein DHV28_00550 [Ignavibacteriales bacterium]|nr:hypothetical protein [Ignavibacteriales bacterium]
MEDQHAKISISFKDGLLEISGSENFVSEQIKLFKEIIDGQFQQLPTKNREEKDEENNDNNDGQILTRLQDYQDVLTEHEGKIKILKQVTGKNKQEKSINTALIYLWAKDKLGTPDVPFQEIREACEHQGCLDSTNFATHIKSAKSYILVSGKSKSQSAKLSIPGKSQALQLIQSLKTL